ncbi:outer membrane protein assembly factor BamD [Oceanomicrobium pacificus]|uniref:Outer membrane protein assembly factor BamD n=1 Tax=Oceanomicrobium pacificus TaxID=2692916 RepID=A0A6B0TW94_9RHOB|nr:outer membrane protein assembly factor BamD [Oceanomicrobium pacificus]MXU65434.1 outer membrane protein assembly factor BamD [Oceanomicrobium pacificus]
MRIWRHATTGLLLASALALSACNSNEVSQEALEASSAEEIFTLGEAQLASGNAADAAFSFSEVERLFPYSQWSKRAVMMSAFSYHEAGLYEESRAAAQRYIDFYPADEDAAYAQYLLALSYYDQIVDVGRDQGNTFRALQELRTVIERYPDSDYAKSAELKFDLALNHLAGKEMEIGRYYLKRGHYSAAINRFRSVVEDYQTTAQTPEALHRLVEAYLSLGLTREAETAGAVLGYNYEGSVWYQDSYALLTRNGLRPQDSSDGWLSSIYRQVVRGEWK